MSDGSNRQLRILHLVSAGGAPGALQQTLFMPLLTRMPKHRVTSQVVCLAPGAAPSAVLRQHGAPVHEAPLSRQRFSLRAFPEAVQATRLFRPDVIQAWGRTAELAAVLLKQRCEWKPPVVWSIAETSPLPRDAGFIDRQKLKLAARWAPKVDRLVYTSTAGASQHRRAGFPDEAGVVIPPGVDAARFKPDANARRKLREQLQLSPKSFVVGMLAPFAPDSDYATLLKGLGELIKTHPDVAVVLAGHGVQKGNAALVALLGGGALATRTHLLGEWSDAAALFNACDVVCSSALTDSARTSLMMAMLCGTPCVATGIGAQGEVIGQHGLAVEPGNPAAFVKALTRIIELTPEKRTHMIHAARKHALKEYVSVRSLQRYLQLYCELLGREAASSELPEPAADAAADEATIAAIARAAHESSPAAPQPAPVQTLEDPDSLEAKVNESAPESLPKWRVEQEQKAQAAEAVPAQAHAPRDGDVLEFFESTIAAEEPSADAVPPSPVEEEFDELLSPEALETEAPAAHVQRAAAPRAPKTTQAASEPPAKMDAAARMRAAAREELKRAAAAMSAAAAAPKRPSAAPQEGETAGEPRQRASSG